MNHNNRLSHARSPIQLPPGLQGAKLIDKIPDAIPYEAYITCAIRVLQDGKPLVVVLEPQHTNDVDEAIALFRLLLAAHTPKPGPIDWGTVPESVRRHFQVVAARPNPPGGAKS